VIVSSDVLWENGEFIHARSFTRDVTDRRLAEEALRASERKLSIIYDNSPDALFLTAVEPGHKHRFVSVNETFLKVTGYERERVEFELIEVVFPEEDLNFALPKYDEVVKKCLPVVYEQPARVAGGSRHAEITLTPIFTKGSVTHILGAAKDITARKEAEEALKASEERLKKALAIETVGVIFFDSEGRYAGANEAFAEMSGYSLADMSSRTIHWKDLTPPEFIERSLQAWEELNETGRTTPYEKECFRKDGSRFWGLFAASKLNEQEAVEYVLDVTARKAAEEALREAHDKLEFRVAERTEQLALTNEALQVEMEQHRIAEQQKGELLQKVVTTQEDERRRIARDIHDQLGQRVTALRLHLSSLADALQAHPDLSSRVKPLQKVAEHLDAEVSFLAWELRPAALDDLGLPEATDAFLEEWSRHYSIPAQLHLTGFTDGRLDPEVETHLYRIMQESLNNIAKHAFATHVNVLLKSTDKGVTLIVEDNGKGFDLLRTFGNDRACHAGKR
jgi:PAS domain S-box-containing protein